MKHRSFFYGVGFDSRRLHYRNRHCTRECAAKCAQETGVPPNRGRR